MNKRIEKNIEGIEVIYNKEKNGIEIAFENKELATQEIRTELKAVGFRYFPKFKKWMARQNDKTIATVKKLFAATSEVEEMEVSKKVNESPLNKIDLFKLTTYTEVEREKNYNTKEVAKEIRTALKSRFKFVKFSVTSKDRISVTIKSAPFEKDSIYLKAIQEYTDKLVESYNFCISYDPYGDYGNSYNFYFFGCKVDCNYIQTETTSEIIEAVKQFDIKTAEAEELKRAEEERQYKEYLKEQEEARKEAEERQKQVKVDKEYINNNVEVVDLEEEKQYFVKNAQFANLNKNNTLEQYKKEVEKGEYYLNTLKVTREVYFKDEKSYNLYINMLLHDFDFIEGTGGSYTDDLRINSMTDYYNMTNEEKNTVEWLLKGVAVYYNNKLMFVIDAQGYCYARYVGLIGNMTIIKKEIEYKQVIDTEEVEELKKEAEEITSIFNKVVEKNSLNDWYNTRRKFVKELKDNVLLSFDKSIVQQIKDEKIKNYMYRVLKENDTIIDQFIDNKFTVGEKLTIVKESVICGVSISHIIFNNYEEIEEYNKKSIKMTLGIKNKRGLYNTTIEKDKVLIYRNWIDIPTSVLYEDTSNDFIMSSITKYGSYDTKALDSIINYLSEKNILPTINTYKPVF
ncbi:LPD29 domain-containing protein [uncultured Clostridium sp.]|uniref:LPD29 domain-containing protein n=1 Tax=uncultured Clostridium sp. TaxID=59620 RepID=UPI00260F81CC|nr:LPD29 domain-containing protein [uncultured Clostridium sp.]